MRRRTQVSSGPDEQEATELMTRHGIVRVQAIQYRYKNWRYSNLSDAVAQAERDASKQPGRAD
jgi:hypothetical protein